MPLEPPAPATDAASGPRNLAAELRRSASARPDHPAIAWQDQVITYGDLDAAVDRAVVGLRARGIQRGDRVALLLGNVPAFVEATYAVARAGGVVVALNHGLAPDEVAHALTLSGAQMLVASATVIDSVIDIALELELDVVVAGAVDLPAGASRWRDVVGGSQPADDPSDVVHDDAAGPDDLAALMFTSGTAGRPKAAMLTHGNLLANQAQSLAGRLHVDQDDVVLLVLPLSHIYAFNVGMGVAVAVGATMVLQERFDPSVTMDVIFEQGVTVVLGAPAMYVAWCNLSDLPEAAFSGVRLAASGAAALSARVLEAFRSMTGLVIQEGYGLTEAGPSVASSVMSPAARPGAVGHPLPGVEVRVVDADGQVVDVGDAGQVTVRGPNVFVGYLDDPEASASILVDGWLHTGDVGMIDEDGYLHLLGRDDDLINVSGFNVYPREVERALRHHEAVEDVAVVGVPHPFTGQSVKAFVVSRDEVTEDDLVAFARSLLARYKCPETVELVEVLPITSTGKVRRSALRELH